MTTGQKKILELNAYDPGGGAALDAATGALVARRRSSFGTASPLFYERPVAVERAAGVWLYGADGSRYLDAYNNVPSVGHCHPRVVEAIARQAATLNTHTRYLYGILYDYAERLLASFPEGLGNLVFTCTGSESSDLALRIARLASGNGGVIVTENAYHGNTTAVSEISPSSASGLPPDPLVFTVPAPDGSAGGFAAGVERALAAMAARDLRPAALFVDSIFSSDGIWPDPPGFLAPAVAAVRAAGGLFVADEVQPGFGRTGAGFWGFSRHGVEPDLVVLGKPMGNGFPLGAVVLRPALLEAFAAEAGYFNTFGGNPVAAAAGLAVLEAIEAEGLVENAATVGALLLEGLRGLAGDHPEIGAVRGAGLYLGVEFRDGQGAPDAVRAKAVVNALRARRVLIGTAGLHGNVLKIRPPLCFGADHAALLLEALAAVLREPAPAAPS